ncbi:hypothetical protein KO506_06535 [Polaribacter vadi]|uniref:hypothetical protein n=1 Tax=Polaribacter TaxID=52959 RepID=UPI001C09F068|nr:MULTISPECIES: hypothetical protein [Polaribacter]MBU3011052.1 hypothetical protein [Polaribacter vadi]MDO6740866.1 hypothetical protein [Polaribacter sp. 1_MG-2023]
MNKKLKNLFFLVLSIITFINCGANRLFMKQDSSFTENFNNQETFKKNWKDNSWKSPALYQLENQHLKITTRPNTKDRVKIRSKQKFTTGTYSWRIFVPKFKMYEQVSIGAFLYHNQKEEFEFDFEIGSGQKIDREQINLKDNEAIVFCVSQFSPSNSSHFAVKMEEYATFKMELIDVNGFYLVKWFINNNLVKTLQTNVKSNTKFKVHCSLENLHFMGDLPTSTENNVLFDAFQYQETLE